MAVFRPFEAVRPTEELVAKVAALPYDVMSSQEARVMVEGNPYSFLHVDRAEIDLPTDVDIYDEKVYEKAASNLNQMIDSGVYIKEQKPCFYIYKQQMGDHSQAGIVGCASIDDYLNNKIKKHELTRADKEEDRVRHVDTCDANTGPIFLTYKQVGDISSLTKEWMNSHNPVYDFTSEDGIIHTVWVIDENETIEKLHELFADVPSFYIADGHHRAASAVRVGKKRREENPEYTGDEEFNYFLAVLFPDEELSIWDYNRVLKEWNGYTKETLLKKLAESFDIETITQGDGKPKSSHTMGMYVDGNWYRLTVKNGMFDATDPVQSLDVSILQNLVLNPIFGIEDPRVDERIAFVGGIRGMKELESMVDGGMSVAFALYPTSVQELMAIADSGKIMPPKSTWFEPKLRSGIFVHQLK